MVALVTAAVQGRVPREQGRAALAALAPEGALAGYVAALLAVLDGAPDAAPALLHAALAALTDATAGERANALRGVANVAHELGDVPTELAARQQGITAQRQVGESEEALVALSIMLYNLAGCHARQGDHAAAVPLLEEVVALDERTNHPDLESDRATLERARKLASGEAPDEPDDAEAEGVPAALAAQLEAMLAALPPEERVELAVLAQVAPVFQQARALLHHAEASATDRARLAAQVEEMAGQAAAGEGDGSPWLVAAAALRALAALLRGADVQAEVAGLPERWRALLIVNGE